MNENQEVIHDKDAEKESGELPQDIPDGIPGPFDKAPVVENNGPDFEIAEKEKAKELAKKIHQELPVVGSRQALKNLFMLAIPKTTTETPAHNPSRKRGVGITRKSHAKSAKAQKQAEKSRKINHKRANKVRRPTGSKARR